MVTSLCLATSPTGRFIRRRRNVAEGHEGARGQGDTGTWGEAEAYIKILDTGDVIILLLQK